MERAKMPRSKRAFQFAPFDSLKGLHDALKRKEMEHLEKHKNNFPEIDLDIVDLNDNDLDINQSLYDNNLDLNDNGLEIEQQSNENNLEIEQDLCGDNLEIGQGLYDNDNLDDKN